MWAGLDWAGLRLGQGWGGAGWRRREGLEREGMGCDFGDASLPTRRLLHLPPFSPACSAAKFNGVHSIDLHFPSNFGADHTSISFVGLRGEFTERRRQAVEAVYETKPMPQVKPGGGGGGGGWFGGGGGNGGRSGQ